ncbi:MAG: sulfite exporter TauE/SafE family protein [Actinomycetota bacterium]|nr:sulfite exporter TauE/SafE family protein [Actinomycetota bacterium]
MSRSLLRRLLLTAALAVVGFVALPAGVAAAHPLGNFSVNRYSGLTLHPDRIDALVVADLAELPTLQDSAPSCTEAATALHVSADGAALPWTIKNTSLTYAAGAGGLRTTRLECRLSAQVDISRQLRVDVTNQFRGDRLGWHELVANGSGVKLPDSSLPTASSTNELRSYPTDPLASPLDIRSASFTATPDSGSSSVVPGTASAPAAVEGNGSTGLLAGAERTLEDLVSGRQLTPLVGLLAVLLSLVLGAAHAALPGHGKTVMAAYLAGSRGRPRDAVLVGATVTFTHTAGVIALGLLLTSVSTLAGESVLAWLGVVSGALVTTVGIGALTAALRRRNRPFANHSHPDQPAIPVHEHTHPADATSPGTSHVETAAGHVRASHDNGHLHAESAVLHGGVRARTEHGQNHSHVDGRRRALLHGHHHGHSPSLGDGHDHGPGKWGIAGLGVAGGLVPSPSALIVLLGAAALGRTVFGVLLVLAYGLGMAATLTAAGLLLVRLRHRLEGRWRLADRWRAVSPSATAALIIVVGLGLAGRALTGMA